MKHFLAEYKSLLGLAPISNMAEHGYLCAFLGVKTFVDFTSLFGLYGTFWTYGGITLVGVMFYCLVVPETREEPLREMQVREARSYVGVNSQ